MDRGALRQCQRRRRPAAPRPAGCTPAMTPPGRCSPVPRPRTPIARARSCSRPSPSPSPTGCASGKERGEARLAQIVALAKVGARGPRRAATHHPGRRRQGAQRRPRAVRPRYAGHDHHRRPMTQKETPAMPIPSEETRLETLRQQADKADAVASRPARTVGRQARRRARVGRAALVGRRHGRGAGGRQPCRGRGPGAPPRAAARGAGQARPCRGRQRHRGRAGRGAGRVRRRLRHLRA